MPPMPVYYVGKGTQFRALDMFDGSDRSIYDAALARVSSTDSMQDLATQRSATPTEHTAITDHDVQHFERDWLTEWWPNKSVDLVLRGGIRKAIEIALPTEERPKLLPIEALWVCANEDVFHVYVNEGPHQVTVIIFTPPPKYPEPGPSQRVFEERIWVVKTRDEYDGAYGGLNPDTIERLNPDDAWPVLIARQLHYAITEPPQGPEQQS